MQQIDVGFCKIGVDFEEDYKGLARVYIYAEWNNGRDRADICRVGVSSETPNTLTCAVWDSLHALDTDYETTIKVEND